MLLLFVLILLNIPLMALVITVESPDSKNAVPTILIKPTNVDYNELKVPAKRIVFEQRTAPKPSKLSLNLQRSRELENDNYKFCLTAVCGIILVLGVTLGFVELVSLAYK